uniref:Uncharacterized protein n=1 Tax=Lepeophtheirus salmonis TaxID=72036 RepID=A0A0K2USE5_LEPSM
MVHYEEFISRVEVTVHTIGFLE